jgi:hypothetical protein
MRTYLLSVNVKFVKGSGITNDDVCLKRKSRVRINIGNFTFDYQVSLGLE